LTLLFLASAAAAAPDHFPREFADTVFEKHMAALKKKLPADGGFNICLEKPLVVVGDLPPDREMSFRAKRKPTLRDAKQISSETRQTQRFFAPLRMTNEARDASPAQ
jgi:hypothetical protein